MGGKHFAYFSSPLWLAAGFTSHLHLLSIVLFIGTCLSLTRMYQTSAHMLCITDDIYFKINLTLRMEVCKSLQVWVYSYSSYHLDTFSSSIRFLLFTDRAKLRILRSKWVMCFYQQSTRFVSVLHYHTQKWGRLHSYIQSTIREVGVHIFICEDGTESSFSVPRTQAWHLELER